jgi:hypothetical protein
MRSVVVYESMFGNTREIAEAAGAGLADRGSVTVVEVGSLEGVPADADLLVIGGPTHAFSMSRASTRADAHAKNPDAEIVSVGHGLREWIDSLPADRRGRMPVAVFDTKVRHPRLPGSAAKAAAKALQAHGFRLVAKPETFDVDGMTGPLLPGETERARAWAASLHV